MLLAPWLSGLAGSALQSGGATRGALQSFLVGWGLSLCTPTRWCHWLESVFRWATGMSLQLDCALGCALPSGRDAISLDFMIG